MVLLLIDEAEVDNKMGIFTPNLWDDSRRTPYPYNMLVRGCSF
jgi:hypothetical protein